MENPARRLEELLLAWAASYNPNVSAFAARGLQDRADEDYAKQMEAFRLLITIEHSLDYLAKRVDISVYREQLKSWINMVLNAPYDWNAGGNVTGVFPANASAHLHTLATLLDVDRPDLSSGPAKTLRDVIAEVEQLLAEDESISDALRSYLHRLISEMRVALDDEAVTASFDFAEAAERLWVGLQAAAGQSKRQKGKWRATASKLFYESSAAALGSLPTLTLAMYQLMQTSGHAS